MKEYRVSQKMVKWVKDRMMRTKPERPLSCLFICPCKHLPEMSDFIEREKRVGNQNSYLPGNSNEQLEHDHDVLMSMFPHCNCLFSHNTL